MCIMVQYNRHCSVNLPFPQVLQIRPSKLFNTARCSHLAHWARVAWPKWVSNARCSPFPPAGRCRLGQLSPPSRAALTWEHRGELRTCVPRPPSPQHARLRGASSRPAGSAVSAAPELGPGRAAPASTPGRGASAFPREPAARRGFLTRLGQRLLGLRRLQGAAGLCRPGNLRRRRGVPGTRGFRAGQAWGAVRGHTHGVHEGNKRTEFESG